MPTRNKDIGTSGNVNSEGDSLAVVHGTKSLWKWVFRGLPSIHKTQCRSGHSLHTFENRRRTAGLWGQQWWGNAVRTLVPHYVSLTAPPRPPGAPNGGVTLSPTLSPTQGQLPQTPTHQAESSALFCLGPRQHVSLTSQQGHQVGAARLNEVGQGPIPQVPAWLKGERKGNLHLSCQGTSSGHHDRQAFWPGTAVAVSGPIHQCGEKDVGRG